MSKLKEFIYNLFDNENVSEIIINDMITITYEEQGKLNSSDFEYSSDELNSFIKDLVSKCKSHRYINDSLIKFSYNEDIEGTIVWSPIVINQTLITINKSWKHSLTYKDLIRFNGINENMILLMRNVVESFKSILITHNAGGGGRTYAHVLEQFYYEKIHTAIISTNHLAKPFHKGSTTFDPSTMTKDEFCYLKEKLRMDTYIFDGLPYRFPLETMECIEDAVGSMLILQVKSENDILDKLRLTLKKDVPHLSNDDIDKQLARSFDYHIHVKRIEDGSRKTSIINEIKLSKEGKIIFEPIFELNHKEKAIEKNGRISFGSNTWLATGYIPSLVEERQNKGINFPRGLFENPPGVEAETEITNEPTLTDFEYNASDDFDDHDDFNDYGDFDGDEGFGDDGDFGELEDEDNKE